MAKEIIVEKYVVINKPAPEIYNYLILLANQEKFSVWNMADPAKRVNYEGTDGTVGFIYSWDSKIKNVGAGSQEIKRLVEGKEIECELRFERPMKNVGTTKFTLEKVTENQTKVGWDFRGPTKFPMSLFKGIFQKMLGKDIAKSLENLKGILEA